jgi:hypothetical protein
MCITLSKGEVEGGLQGDHSNVKAITLDHPGRCPSSEIGVGDWEPDSKGSARGVEGRRIRKVATREREWHGSVHLIETETCIRQTTE